MKTKILILTGAVLASTALSAQASLEGAGVGVGFDAISGKTLEINYPINESFQIRGSIASGMNMSADQTEDGVYYAAKADGANNRLSLNYHPFQGNFFMSVGYSMNNFGLDVNGSGSGSVTVGSDSFNNATVNLKGGVDWSNSATLSMGWGHSFKSGWGLLFEAGAAFTGAPNVSLTGTGTYDNGGGAVDVSSDPVFQNALKAEEDKLRNDIAGVDFLPIIQAQATYRF